MLTVRSLDPREVNLRHLEPALAVAYEGHLDTVILEKAFRILGERYLFLRSCIRDDGESPTLHIPTDHYPEFVALAGSWDDLRSTLRYPARIEHGVCRLIVTTAGRSGHVALQVNHSIMDGRTVQTLFAELWDHYTELAEGHAIDPTPSVGLTQPPTAFVDENWPTIQKLLGTSPNPFAEKRNTPVIGEFPDERWLVLSPEDTDSFVAASRGLKTSVHALVCGSMLNAARRHIPLATPVRMTCGSIVDLRSRATPPLSPTDTANFSVWSGVDVAVALDEDPISIGRNVKQALDAALGPGGGEPVAPPDVRAERDTDQFTHLRTIAVTNPGIVATFASPRDLSFTALHWLHSVASQFPVKSAHAVYAAYTFNRQMTITGIYPREHFSTGDVDTIFGTLRDNLRAICTATATYNP
ncbi:hypothetical protein [Amycolatopsis sp. GM8]|uniref:phthiocerol/phthiodiolone dimycocerosyl transferase family protein n=1 Tax=Amycolatopsis sp. GM8 TaxID=2896530 RepID=UPI001F339A1A|nr:hypothetical protein [Amycolatopsis sp. GM8]